MIKLQIIWRVLRMNQWIKNFLIFAAPIGAALPFLTENLLISTQGFLAMCLVASSIYIINDFKDQAMDTEHPLKKFRPIASGEFSTKLALPLSLILLISSLLISLNISQNSAITLGAYFLINFLYSMKLKQIAILELGIVSSGYALRILFGAQIFDLIPSRWLMISAFSAAFGVVVAKRKSELISTNRSKIIGRNVLNEYTSSGLQSAATLAFSTSFTTYSLWLFEKEVQNQLILLSSEILGLVLFVTLVIKMDRGELETPENLKQHRALVATFCVFAVLNFVLLYF
jgi:decaprenyl-phosphate phosphoribosyltransferase